ncbi:MAG: hypothetical protein V7646_4822 [Pseudonocardia sp.]|jgi:hypothetical protein
MGPEFDELRKPLAELRAPLQELCALRGPRDTFFAISRWCVYPG